MRIGPIGGLLLLVGCAGATPVERDCPPACGAPVDAGVYDGAVAARDAAMNPASDAGPSSESAFDACFNGVDDDSNGLTDCEDVSACSATPYCCVGSMSAACCAPSVAPVDLDFSGCADGDALGCLDGAATAFGGPLPQIEAGAFVPNGDSFSDSGLVIGAPLEPTTHRVGMQATLRAVPDGCVEADPCIDVVGFGFGDAPSGPGHLEPDVGVLVRASRNDYALLVAGEVIQTGPLPDGEGVYRLEVTPAGEASFWLDATLILTTTYFPRPARAAMLYGRTHNRSSGSQPASASGLRVTEASCEVVDAWDRGATPSLLPGALGAATVRRPSVIDANGPVAAFEIDGAIHLARRQLDGEWALEGTLDVPALAPPAGERFEDPDLHVTEDGRYELYVTRVGSSASSIGYALGEPDLAPAFGAVTTIPVAGGGSPRAPAVLGRAPERLLAAVIDDGGEPVIALFGEQDGVFRALDGAAGSRVVVRPGDGFAHFDDDAVGDPALVRDPAGLLRLYYAGRRGSRFSLGMRVSADGIHFRDPLAGRALFEPGGAGHDALSVRSPSLLRFADGEPELYYEAYDGVERSIGRAVRSAP